MHTLHAFEPLLIGEGLSQLLGLRNGEFLPSMRSHVLIGIHLQLQREHLYPLRHLDIPP